MYHGGNTHSPYFHFFSFQPSFDFCLRGLHWPSSVSTNEGHGAPVSRFLCLEGWIIKFWAKWFWYRMGWDNWIIEGLRLGYISSHSLLTMLPFDFVNFTGWLPWLAQLAFFLQSRHPCLWRGSFSRQKHMRIKTPFLARQQEKEGPVSHCPLKDMPSVAWLPPSRPHLWAIPPSPNSLQTEEQVFTTWAAGEHLRWRPLHGVSRLAGWRTERILLDSVTQQTLSEWPPLDRKIVRASGQIEPEWDMAGLLYSWAHSSTSAWRGKGFTSLHP